MRENSKMGRLFIFLIWNSLFVSMNGQVLFDDMGERQRSADLALQFMRTELQQFSQDIERMIMIKLEGVENIIEAKIGNLERKNNESIFIIQNEQRLLNQKIESLTTILSEKVDEKISNLFSTTQIEHQLLNQKVEFLTTNLSEKVEIITDLIALTTTEQRFLRQEMSFTSKSITNCLMKSENALDDVRNTSLYVAEQLSSGEVIHVLRYLEMISRLNNVAGYDCAYILHYYPDTRGKDGVYDIMGFKEKKAVYCDMTTDKGGWTVIQRRVNGLVDFRRNWTEYKRGFGFADHEYWIGNDMLHRLTSVKSQELRVDMGTFDEEKAYAVYSSFSVGDEDSKYKLHVQGYSGNAGNSMNTHNDMGFSTPDQDNDGWSSGNCAVGYMSGWWFNLCCSANPNGRYTHSTATGNGYIAWYDWKPKPLKMIQMMIRHRP